MNPVVNRSQKNRLSCFGLNSESLIRVASKADAMQCLAIYEHYVCHTANSFESTVPSEDEFATRIQRVSEIYPWLVYEVDAQICGYAYASSFRPRPAYNWNAEVTIYLNRSAKGKGIASQLYLSLLEQLTRLGYFNAIAVITEPNPESEKFHVKMGFNKIGSFKAMGYKLNQWHDLGWWQKQLKPFIPEPPQPRPFRHRDELI